MVFILGIKIVDIQSIGQIKNVPLIWDDVWNIIDYFVYVLTFKSHLTCKIENSAFD